MSKKKIFGTVLFLSAAAIGTAVAISRILKQEHNLPDIIGLPADIAVEKLKENGFKKVDVVYEEGFVMEDLSEDKYAEYEVKESIPGEEATKGQRIRLIVRPIKSHKEGGNA